MTLKSPKCGQVIDPTAYSVYIYIHRTHIYIHTHESPLRPLLFYNS